LQIQEFTVSNELTSIRLDKAVSQLVPELTRSHVQNMLENGFILVNQNKLEKNYKLKLNDVIIVNIPDLKPIDAIPQDIPLDVVYEDSDLIVINKPQGMVVHPAAGNWDGTLVNALLHHCGNSLSGINGVIRPGIVHRIDKNTSGLLIVAKNDNAHKLLAAQIKAHSFTRIYEAVVIGNIKDDEGTIDAPIGRNPTQRKRMTVIEKNSKNAVTHYKVLKRYDKFTHVQLKLETGRTHQIRVHMAYIGHPIAGDEVYGSKKQPNIKKLSELKGQCLHAKVIGFVHPTTCEYMEFTSALPQYFTSFLEYIEKASQTF
jgi:23S rRNA pseudouridine1911/1915/1917 synthase